MIHQSGASIVDWARKRIPPSYEVLSLFATIVFLIYGWTSVAFLWKLPSWLNFLNTGEIMIIVAHILTSDLLESLMVLSIFIFASIVLPPKWLRDDLAVRGSMVMYVVTFWAVVFTLNSLIIFPSGSELLFMALGLLASLGVVGRLIKKSAVARSVMTRLSHRLIIFLYVWIPLSLTALAVVIFRWFERGLAAL